MEALGMCLKDSREEVKIQISIAMLGGPPFCSFHRKIAEILDRPPYKQQLHTLIWELGVGLVCVCVCVLIFLSSFSATSTVLRSQKANTNQLKRLLCRNAQYVMFL